MSDPIPTIPFGDGGRRVVNQSQPIYQVKEPF
jgi:hypothetical protein